MEKNEKYFGVRGFIPLTVRRLAWLPIQNILRTTRIFRSK
jgi:hypothetical protein